VIGVRQTVSFFAQGTVSSATLRLYLLLVQGLWLAAGLHGMTPVNHMSAEVIVLISTLSPLMASVAAAFTGGVVLLFVRLRQFRVFRGYRELKDDLDAIAHKLEHGVLARDKEDVLVTGQFRQVSFFIRFSHSETAPGLYIRCSAPVNFTLTFVGSTPENADAIDVCRTGDLAFDRRFVGRTDNRPRAKQFLGQPRCQEHLQQLCCSNKTMLRLAEDTIELSEALIPSDTGRHVISHIESMRDLSERLAATTASGRTSIGNDAHRGASWAIRVAVVAAITLVVTGYFVYRESPAAASATVTDATPQDKLPGSGLLVPNPNGWTVAGVTDFNPDFVAWLKRSGVTPETKITLNPGAEGDGTSVVHVLRPTTGERTRRVVWMLDNSVVFDLVGPLEGVTRIPKESLLKISWAEGSAPTFTPDGDGLLVVRDHSKPGTATVYFTSQRILHTAVPADFEGISLL
jgi:hypothetical protein